MRHRITVFIGVLLGLGLSLIMAATFTIQGGYRGEWQLARTEANGVSTTINVATQGDYAQKPAGAVRIGELTNQAGSGPILFAFAGGGDPNDILGWRLWSWARQNGPAECAGYGTATLGSQQVITYPDTGLAATARYWADIITVTSQYWPCEIEVFDTGNDRIAKMAWDSVETDYMYLEITDANGAGSEAGAVSAYYRVLSK